MTLNGQSQEMMFSATRITFGPAAKWRFLPSAPLLTVRLGTRSHSLAEGRNFGVLAHFTVKSWETL